MMPGCSGVPEISRKQQSNNNNNNNNNTPTFHCMGLAGRGLTVCENRGIHSIHRRNDVIWERYNWYTDTADHGSMTGSHRS
jgi:hypothetical protein